MAISTEQKLDNFRNMKSMIDDYAEKYNRFPSIKEFEDGLDMARMTVFRYKKVIVEENRKNMLEHFENDMITRMNRTIADIDDGLKKLKEISKNGKYDSDKISAIKGIVELNIDVISIMRDGDDFLKPDNSNDGNDSSSNVSKKQERIYEEIQSEKVIEGIKSINN